MSIFSKIKQALFKTGSLISTNEEKPSTVTVDEKINLNEDFFDDLFEKLIRADVGFELSEKIIDTLKKKFLPNNNNAYDILTSDFKFQFKEIIKKILSSDRNILQNIPTSEKIVFLIVGVNGSGKTTSIAKLANRFKLENKKVLVIAGDTFRAAAQDQLSIWAQRINVDLYSPSEVKKPDAVVYSGLEKAKKEDYDIVIVDTAGRLHSQTNLMEELKKIETIVEKNSEDFQKEKLIVLDATIGQNSILQAQEFGKTVKLSGIILSKLDGSSKGGVILNIMNELSLPVKYIGLGEKAEDMAEFNFDEYLEGLV